MSARRSAAALRIADCTPMAKVTVRASPYGPVLGELTERSGVPFGRAVRGPGGWLVAGVVPGGWLLIDEPGSASTLIGTANEIAGDGPATITEVTHASVLLLLTGPAAPLLLAKISLVDLDDQVVPTGTVLRTAVAGVTTSIIRDDQGDAGGHRSYLLLADRSYGGYLFDVLLDAGAEQGIEVDGVARG